MTKQSDRWQKTPPQGERYHAAPCSLVTPFCHHSCSACSLAPRSLLPSVAPSRVTPTCHGVPDSPPANEHQ